MFMTYSAKIEENIEKTQMHKNLFLIRIVLHKVGKILNLNCIVVQTYMTNTQIGRYWIPNFVGVGI